MEKVDVLAPPRFEPTGVVKTAKQAIEDGDWLGSINIWLYTTVPEPSIIYQVRSPQALWAPNLLDVASGGAYRAGEQGLAGIHELREELGVDIPKQHMQFFGRKLGVGVDVKGRERKWCISVYVAEYGGVLADMKLQPYEVYGVVRAPIGPLMEVFHDKREAIEVEGMDAAGNPMNYRVTKSSFPDNFDDYQRRMAEYIALKLGVDDAYIRN